MPQAGATALPAPREMTLAEWASLPEDEPGEVVDGLLEDEEMPNVRHERVIVWIVLQAGAWALPRGGDVVGSEARFAVSPRRGRKPDVSIYLPGARLPSRRATLLQRPPSIAVEVISPSPRDAKRDRVDKFDEYAAFGVPWYWLIDPELHTIEIYELGADHRYARALGAGEGVIAAPGCEGLSLDLDALWVHADRAGEEDEE